jgi:serine/threonine protein kinase
VFFGTMEFAPPEQYGFAQTDCRADIFSLGVVLCLLLTGKTKPAEANFKNRHLAAVIQKCTAFAPKDRYHNVQMLRRALLHQNIHGWRRMAGLAAGILLLIVGSVWWQGWMFKPPSPAVNGAGDWYATASAEGISQLPIADSVQFSEPLVERAVRARLGKSADEILTSADLQAVTALYIFADQCTADVKEFERMQQGWDQNNGTITLLSDLAYLPNLRELCLSAQNISDISPVAGLTALEKIELRHNPVADISPLSDLKKLKMIGLNDTRVTDLSPVINLEDLELLDLNDADYYDPAVLAERNTFDFLDISNNTGSYRYLDGKTIRTLKIMETNVDSLSWLANVKGLEELYLSETKLADLTGINAHKDLAYLNISQTRIHDLSPLLALPYLQQVVVDSSMKKAAEAIAADAEFEIIYE